MVEKLPLLLVVAAALIDVEGRVLLTQRPAGKHMAGMWEFPGGKIHEGETPEQALVRELGEELGIVVEEKNLFPLSFASHRYEEFHLLMTLYGCRSWVNEPKPIEGQSLVWADCRYLLDNFEMPPADLGLVPALRFHIKV